MENACESNLKTQEMALSGVEILEFYGGPLEPQALALLENCNIFPGSAPVALQSLTSC